VDRSTGVASRTGSMTRPTHGTPENLRAKKHSGQLNDSLATTQSKPAQVEQQKLKTTAPDQPAQHVSCDSIEMFIIKMTCRISWVIYRKQWTIYVPSVVNLSHIHSHTSMYKYSLTIHYIYNIS